MVAIGLKKTCQSLKSLEETVTIEEQCALKYKGIT